jgi:hypothetical protein
MRLTSDEIKHFILVSVLIENSIELGFDKMLAVSNTNTLLKNAKYLKLNIVELTCKDGSSLSG